MRARCRAASHPTCPPRVRPLASAAAACCRPCLATLQLHQSSKLHPTAGEAPVVLLSRADGEHLRNLGESAKVRPAWLLLLPAGGRMHAAAFLCIALHSPAWRCMDLP